MSFYSRFSRGMSNGGAIMARNGEPLTDDALRAVCPSIFATEAHESRSHRFAPVPTVAVLAGLRAEGFDPFFAQQAKTRVEGKAEFTKHMLRLRHRSTKNEAGQAFEIVLVNANDGTSAYQMIPGYFRFVCANGLMAGESFDTVKVRHTGDAAGAVIEGAYRVLGEAPMLADQVAQMQGLRLSDDEREIMAEAAHMLRFPASYEEGGKAAPISPAALLRPRRTDDRAGDLWTAFNVVQENTIRGGLHGRTLDGNGRIKRTSTREVQGIDQGKAINRALWMVAERMAQIKLAA